MLRTVYMRAKHDALFRNLPAITQRKNLKTTTIREDRTIP